MTSGTLQLVTIWLFVFVGASLFLFGVSLLSVRLCFPVAWQAYLEALQVERINPNLIGCLKTATNSDPHAGSNTLLQVSLTISEVLMYPAGVLFLVYIGVATVSNLGG